MLLISERIKEEIRMEIRKYLEMSKNENIPKLMGTVKAVLRGKPISLNILVLFTIATRWKKSKGPSTDE